MDLFDTDATKPIGVEVIEASRQQSWQNPIVNTIEDEWHGSEEPSLKTERAKVANETPRPIEERAKITNLKTRGQLIGLG